MIHIMKHQNFQADLNVHPDWNSSVRLKGTWMVWFILDVYQINPFFPSCCKQVTGNPVGLAQLTRAVNRENLSCLLANFMEMQRKIRVSIISTGADMTCFCLGFFVVVFFLQLNTSKFFLKLVSQPQSIQKWDFVMYCQILCE